MLTRGVPHTFRDGAHLLIPSTAIGSVPNFYQVTQLRTDDVHCREAAGKGPVVVLKAATSSSPFSGLTMNQLLLCVSLFPRPLLVQKVSKAKETYEVESVIEFRFSSWNSATYVRCGYGSNQTTDIHFRSTLL